MNRLKSILATLLVIPSATLAGDLKVIDAWIPVAPPGVMSHAAYLTLENTDETAQNLVSIRAEGYGLAHLHKTEEKDGIATMAMIDQIKIPTGKALKMEPGGLHVMLMRPEKPVALGDKVTLTLGFTDGTTMALTAQVRDRNGGS